MRFARAAFLWNFVALAKTFSPILVHAAWRRKSVCSLLSDRETNRDSFIPVPFFLFYLVSSIRYCVCSFSRGYLEFCRINRRRSVFVEFFEGEEIWPWIKTDYFVRGYSLVFHFWKRSVHRAWDVVFACVYMYIYTCVVRSAFLHALSSIEPGFSCLVYCISMVISEVVLYKWRGSFLLVEAMVDNRKYTLILYYRF